MIYYNAQLMSDDASAILFMVNNSVLFERFEDHEAAIHFHIHQLVEQAIASGESPVALVEDYLDISYTDGSNPHEISDFLLQSDVMQSALGNLKENWHQKSTDLPDEGLLFGQGIAQNEILERYSKITLRSYLETLSTFNR